VKGHVSDVGGGLTVPAATLPPTLKSGRSVLVRSGVERPAACVVVRAPGMQDDALRISATAVVAERAPQTVSVLVDTGAQLSLVRRGLFPADLFQPAKCPTRLVTADRQPLMGGDRAIELELCFDGKCSDSSERPLIRVLTTLVEADISDDVIVSYSWLGSTEFDVSPRRHCIFRSWGAAQIQVEGLPAPEGRPSAIPTQIRLTEARPRRALDLFSGTGSAATALRAHGFRVTTVDNDPRWSPDICTDILTWDFRAEDWVPGDFDVIVAAPPCTEFSRALTTRPRRPDLAYRLVERALEIVHYFRPATWWIETPANGLLARDERLQRLPHLDCDQCQFSDYGYQKPTRFFGSDHLRLLEPVLCDQRTCPSLVEDPDGLCRLRKHRNSQGGNAGYVHKFRAYRLPPKLVEYVTGLSGPPERKCAPAGSHWRAQDYAVQRARVEEITAALGVAPTVDAFSTSNTARFARWWGPGSAESEDAFSKSWTDEFLWLNPPFALFHRVLAKVVQDRAHAVIIVPEWPNKSFFQHVKELEIRSRRFECGQGIFEKKGKPLRNMRWNAQAVFICGDRAGCPAHMEVRSGVEAPTAAAAVCSSVGGGARGLSTARAAGCIGACGGRSPFHAHF